MSDQILEDHRNSSLRLIVEGRDNFLNTNDFKVKQQSYSTMKKGCEGLLVYLRNEKDQNIIMLISEQLNRYIEQLTKFSQELKQNQQSDEIEIVFVQKQELLYTQDSEKDIQVFNTQYGQYVEIQLNTYNQRIQIIGLEQQKQKLREHIGLPILFPNLFQGARKLQTSILLFGPKGSGKTELIRYLASEWKTLLLIVNVSMIIEIGEQIKIQELKNEIEQLIKNKSFIILLQNLEDCPNRKSLLNFFEKYNLKELIDNGKLVSNVIGCSSQPWKIHHSIRRIFENRIEINLMSQDQRIEYLSLMLLQKEQNKLKYDQIVEIAKLTNKFTGLDLKNLIQQAIKIQSIKKLENNDQNIFSSVLDILQTFQISVSDNDFLQFRQWREDFCL
ncbi:unnamed protein product [Paramecium sonneborni]|uniref:AAA+ ATPase domain-containing protein n=1 Tax=Paramecium sonneborni TaxID=65129 RepID=A0A8S1KU01_9CILI|nr:unnamed protein product [Paramecium sonneborni]